MDKARRAQSRQNLCLWGLRQWRNERLRRKESCQFSIVFAHHPYASPGNHGDATLLQKFFLESEVIGVVDMLIGGHDHILADEGQIQGTHLLISGSAGKIGRIENISKNSLFYRAAAGLLTLSFSRKKAELVANTTFYAFSNTKDFNKAKLQVVWQRQIRGVGIRD